MFERSFFFLAIFMILTGEIHSQYTNVMISNQNGCNEPSIIINPKNTNQLYAGANLNNYYYSDDGGYSWSEGQLYSPEYGVWGDPAMMCDTAGAFYFFHLSNPAQGSWIDRIVCQKADTLGASWNDGTYMGLNGTKAQDKEWPTVNRTNNHIFVTWTQFDSYGSSNPDLESNIMFSRSFDSGETWSPALRINDIPGDCIDSDNTTEGAVPCVGPDGEIYVAWAGPMGIVFDRSMDEGDTWLDEDIFVSDFPGGWDYDIPGINRCNGLPVTLCDTSDGPYRGSIYVNWTDQRNGTDDTDVWIAKSTDGGDNWSEPIRVNDDPPGKHQFFTWMTIDQTNGYLYLVWYDRRNYEDNNTDVYMARSTDGGDSFMNFKISASPFLPYSSVFFGDYTNITAYNNVIRPIWCRAEGNSRSIWTAIVSPFVVGVEEHDVELFTEQKSYPNPFRESTFFSFSLHRSSLVSLKVFNQFGQEVATMVDSKVLAAGEYTYQLEAKRYNLAPGIYYFSLVGPEEVIRQKVVLVR